MKKEAEREARTMWEFICTFLKWLVIAGVTGGIGGLVGSAFHLSVNWAATFRAAHPWLLWLLPVGGLLIAAIYRLTKMENKNTNAIIDAIHFGDKVPLLLVPAIYLSTVITHLFGGSAGREGAALQIGGSLGCYIGRLFHLDEKDMRIATLCGMSAVFSALFGTPLTATIFALEVISVGVFYYSALVPCIVASLAALAIANAFGIADDVLKQAVSSISELVGYSENVIINLDFADVSAIMRNAGQAHMGVGSATGRDKAEQAAQAAVSSPLLETSINGATGVLINIAGSHDLGLDDVETAANIVMEAANPDANIIFGATISDEFQDEMRVTVIATGFEMKPESFAPSAGADKTARPSKPSFVPDDIDTPVAASKQPTKPADMSDIDEIFSIFKR